MASNNQNSPIINKLNIRTMQKDLSGRATFPARKVSPPPKLPVAPQPAGWPEPQPPFPPPAERKVPEGKPAPSIFAQPKPPKPSVAPPPQPTPPRPPPPKPTIKVSPPPPLSKRRLTSQSWLYLGLGVAVLVLVATLGFLFYQKEIPPEEPPIVEPPPDQLIPTPSLIPEISTTTIRLTERNETELKNKILETAQEYSEGINITRLLITVVENGVKRFLTLSELAEILNLNIPDALQTPAAEAYNLILSSLPSEALATSSNSFKEDRENRLALILETANPREANKTMQDWEATMVQELEGLMLISPGPEATPEFQEVIYHGASLRYKNLPISSITIDYTIYQNLIIITTSKRSIYTIYDLASHHPLSL